MKSLYMKKKKKKNDSDLWRLLAAKYTGQSSFNRAYVTAPATGILHRRRNSVNDSYLK